MVSSLFQQVNPEIAQHPERSDRNSMCSLNVEHNLTLKYYLKKTTHRWNLQDNTHYPSSVEGCLHVSDFI